MYPGRFATVKTSLTDNNNKIYKSINRRLVPEVTRPLVKQSTAKSNQKYHFMVSLPCIVATFEKQKLS